ncbi:hypothetical protein ACOMHN_001387 [Nucella lapillus]
MQEIADSSCVRFIPRSKELDYISIVKQEGCSSSVGRKGGRQDVILGEGCYVTGVVLHELMHALGFWHEHSRPDRDSYISIVWENIATDHRSNFKKYDTSTINTLQTQYDYGSIMHYKNNTFAMDRRRVTINATLPLPPGVEMGQRIRLSDIDVLKLRRLYKCNITHCMDPGVPANGDRVGDSFLVAHSVYYSCHHGYTLYGSRGRFCLDLGQWTGSLPSCLPDPLSELHVCSFDDRSVCGWMSDSTANYNWTVHSRSTPSNNTGPVEDHTMGSAEGWYIYLETSPTKPGDKARLMSPPLTFAHGETVCLMFYYSMHGRQLGTLNVYQRVAQRTGRSQGPADVLIFTRSGEQGTEWKLAYVPLQQSDVITVVMEAVAGSGFQSDMAVDDVVIGPCSSLESLDTSAAADTLKCSFDAGLCGLQQDHVHDDFDWSPHAGQTTTYSTGPKCDPLNCAAGSYLYTESSRPRKRGDVARLVTPLLHGEGARCVLFFWHMEGSGMGNLSVRLVKGNGGRLQLWHRSGHQGGDWQYEKLDIPNPPRYYKLEFEGEVGSSFRSDMAIDNLEVVTGHCSDVVQNDCSFHHDLCSWHNLPGPVSWRRSSGTTPTPNTGPDADHNNNPSEYYLYVESSRTIPNDTARLMSGEISGTGPGHCLQFWYHMHGSTVGTLSLLQTRQSQGEGDSNPGQGEEEEGEEEEVVWQRSGSSENVWHRQSLYVGASAGHSFRLLFQAEMVGGSEGDIAIDDISIHSGQCESP